MIEKLRFFGDEILREKAKPVTNFDKNIREITKNLIESIKHYEGIGLAAPQIGHPVKIFVINPIWFENEKNLEIQIFINPILLSFEGTQNEQEGCLSIPEIFEKVRRAQKVVFKAQNLNGKWKKYNATDTFARVVQHEYDHLDGVLFVDKIAPIRRKLISGKLKKIALAH
ncbi:MAG: peptide deformylase [Candidatus Cloacimonetes bacterium]|nr:peptide deformylase [Candidatus Cloacimonadota bacterium]